MHQRKRANQWYGPHIRFRRVGGLLLDLEQLSERWNTHVYSYLEPVSQDMHPTRLTLIAVLAVTAILAGIVISNALGLTILFSHTFPKTPHGL